MAAVATTTTASTSKAAAVTTSKKVTSAKPKTTSAITTNSPAASAVTTAPSPAQTSLIPVVASDTAGNSTTSGVLQQSGIPISNQVYGATSDGYKFMGSGSLLVVTLALIFVL